MKKYSIQAVSDQLHISRNALRYYDKIQLLCPVRGENNYRYYTEADLLDLQYVEVMKYAGFSLAEISKVIKNKRGFIPDGLHHTTALLADKKLELERKIRMYQLIIELLEEAETVLDRKKESNDTTVMDQMIIRLFAGLEVR